MKVMQQTRIQMERKMDSREKAVVTQNWQLAETTVAELELLVGGGGMRIGASNKHRGGLSSSMSKSQRKRSLR
jgi:hypothetical protein